MDSNLPDFTVLHPPSNPNQNHKPNVMRLTSLAKHNVMKSLESTMSELEDKVCTIMDNLKNPIGSSNTPSGDSTGTTRTTSLTELQIVAERAASIRSSQTIGFGPDLAPSRMIDVLDSLDSITDKLRRNDLPERPICTARPPLTYSHASKATVIPRPIPEDSVLQEKSLKTMTEAKSYVMLNFQGSMNLFPVTHRTSHVMSSGKREKVNSSILSYTGHGKILDLRTPNRPHPRRVSFSSQKSIPEYEEKPIDLSLFTPPNEFDWFSKEDMGQIFSSSASCHLFTALRNSKKQPDLQELYLNGVRRDYPDDSSQDEETLQFVSIAETLSHLPKLQKLVLRGICDDTMLKCIGQSMTHLEHLDVSGSQLVTNAGIQNLLFKNPKYDSAFYLIPSWMAKNKDKMHSIVNTIQYLDHSWTSVSALGRKIIQLLPGSYLFKRLMYLADQDPIGHHIFLRGKSSFESPVNSLTQNQKSANVPLKKLTELVGLKGIKHFLNMVESHPWKRCHFTLYSGNLPKDINAIDHGNNNIFEMDRSRYTSMKVHFGIITPNPHEKRIQGVIHWDWNGNLTELYTIYPVNINQLGNLSNLQQYRGIVHDTWRLNNSILPDLTTLDIFTEPPTLHSILKFCPNLKILKVRIRNTPLEDPTFIKAIQESMSRNSLEQIWLAPGSHMETILRDKSTPSRTSSLLSSTSNSKDTHDSFSGVNSIEDLHRTLSYSDFNPTELIQLSLETLEIILTVCPRIKRVGDLALWVNLEERDLYSYSEHLKSQNNRVTLSWANLDLPLEHDSNSKAK